MGSVVSGPIFVINTDGTGFNQLSDGTRTDFNPTWTRDGLNTTIWNRKNDMTGGFYLMQSKVGNQLTCQRKRASVHVRWPDQLKGSKRGQNILQINVRSDPKTSPDGMERRTRYLC